MSRIQQWLLENKKKLGCDFIGIACNVAPENKPKEIRWLYVAGNQSEAYKHIRLQVGRGIAGIVWKTARTKLDEHISSQPEKLLDYPIARIEQLESVLAVPVLEKNEVAAVLMIGFHQDHIYKLTEVKELEEISNQLRQYLKEES
ncbi:GAF domain-containing protein [Enterococcus hailinensis]|uniref:GAF domain-containing protein n=1 Tax=Enterococcus hailinensis TaxID=3238988 RepID=UPI0038B35F48